MKDYVLFTYSITKLDKSKKVRFVYLLKGRRGDPGIIEEFKGKFLAPGCFIVPTNKSKEVIQIFKLWKVRPKTMNITINKNQKG